MQAAAAVNGMILVSVSGVTVVMVRFCMSALQRKRVLNGPRRMPTRHNDLLQHTHKLKLRCRKKKQQD